MRIITRRRIMQWADVYPDAANALLGWYEVARHAAWGNIQDVRRDFPSADAVEVDSGSTVTVFNIRGNNYRLIVAIHYNTRIVFMLRFLTHKQYDTDKWKREL
jgi:mRNA interferase HigB